MPEASTIHIDAPLTNLSIQYRNATYIADQVLPIVPVTKRSDAYFAYTKADFLSGTAWGTDGMPLSHRRPGTRANQITYTLSNLTYRCEEFALSELVTDGEVRLADSPLQPDQDATIHLTERLLIDNESMVSKLVGTYTNYPTTNKTTLLSGTTSYAAYSSATSDPFTDIVNAKAAIRGGVAREPNTYLMSMDLAQVLADHPLVKDLVKYTHADGLTTTGLPAIMRGLTVIEGNQQKSLVAATGAPAAEGSTYSGGNIWRSTAGTNYSLGLIYYRATAPTIRSVSFGFTFEAPDDASGARGLAVRRWREEALKGNMIEVSFLRDYKFICVDGSGYSIGGYHIAGGTD